MHGDRAAGTASGEPHRRKQPDRERHRPDRKRQDFCLLHADKRPKNRHEPGDRQIDQARPVHQRSALKPQAGLGEVEPALSGEEVAHLDQAHGIVIVAAEIIRRPHELGDEEKNRGHAIGEHHPKEARREPPLPGRSRHFR
ncbi:hypothetical protein [Ensifer adhaerens]|uniref:hypothetical protein n=1 Tax=Ensifer adhaerens TaxID=106592 RepID=UPI001F1C68C9|nr:hypothetical protein [Ensifer adhaerens]